jgi:hypothetical protein
MKNITKKLIKSGKNALIVGNLVSLLACSNKPVDPDANIRYIGWQDSVHVVSVLHYNKTDLLYFDRKGDEVFNQTFQVSSASPDYICKPELSDLLQIDFPDETPFNRMLETARQYNE